MFMNASICYHYQKASFIFQHALSALCDLEMHKYRPKFIQQRVYLKMHDVFSLWFWSIQNKQPYWDSKLFGKQLYILPFKVCIL